MRTPHINLIVADLDVASQFYIDYFDFEDMGQHENIAVLQDNSGMDLVLELGSPVQSSFHFGFRVNNADEVADARQVFEGDDFDILDEGEGGMPSFKVCDPDGYMVEIYAYG